MTVLIDGLQYANWSERIFRQLREGGVDAIHATITYHETFRETVTISSVGTAGSSFIPI